MPVLTHHDIHVLSGVVKQFLRELDEPIVTRVLWRDFVRAADQDNGEDKERLIKQTVTELPTSNRDTLSFIILHLQRVSQSPNTIMDNSSLAKIFGPTIVGHSTIDQPMAEISAENQKQLIIMESLLRVAEEFWAEILLNTSKQSFRNSPDRRRSLGKRLFETGSLTPHRPSDATDESLNLKPLF